MLVFGHVGITLGVAALLSGLPESIRVSKTTRKQRKEPSSPSFDDVQASGDFQSRKTLWLTSLGRHIDIRILLIGSLLPDVIDKPTGLFFFRETFSNGRIFSHTLLFLFLITVAALYFHMHYGKTWLLALSFGTLTHLMFDQMWRTPRTLFWPLLGPNFERMDISNLIVNIFDALFTDPVVYVPELVGAVTLIWFAWMLLHTRRIRVFIKYGQAQ